MKFDLETAPDPTSDVGVAGAQAYILRRFPSGSRSTARRPLTSAPTTRIPSLCSSSCSSTAATSSRLTCPPHLMGYPGALGIDLTAEAATSRRSLPRSRPPSAKRAARAASAPGLTPTATPFRRPCPARHERHQRRERACRHRRYRQGLPPVLPDASWNGSNYTNATTGVKADNTFLVYQDTYIMGDPGWFMHATDVEVPEKYFTVKSSLFSGSHFRSEHQKKGRRRKLPCFLPVGYEIMKITMLHCWRCAASKRLLRQPGPDGYQLHAPQAARCSASAAKTAPARAR